MTLTAYRQKLRVEEACRRLVDTDEPITDIAHEVGYCDYKAFYSVFLKQTGLRPSAYRRRNRLEVPSGVTGGPAGETEGKERLQMKSIGFIGIGVMGRAMAANLIKRGFRVSVYTRSKAKAEAFLKETGAHWSGSVGACAEGAEAVITMVGYPSDVEAVYFG